MVEDSFEDPYIRLKTPGPQILGLILLVKIGPRFCIFTNFLPFRFQLPIELFLCYPMEYTNLSLLTKCENVVEKQQCGENTGGMAAMPRGKLSKNEESYQKHMLFTPYIL